MHKVFVRHFTIEASTEQNIYNFQGVWIIAYRSDDVQTDKLK